MTEPAVSRLSSPPTRSQAVVEHLRTAIVAGELAPGALLREVELALRLGVSPTPVREALVELASEGLVEIEAHRLKRVSPIEPVAAAALLRVQGALWRMGYVWGFPNIGPSQVEALAACVSDYAAALVGGDTLGAIQAGQAFHTLFIAASGNSELLRVTLDRRALIARFILLRGRATVSKSGLREHRAMLDAFTRGDTADVLVRLDRLSAKLVGLAEALAESERRETASQPEHNKTDKVRT